MKKIALSFKLDLQKLILILLILSVSCLLVSSVLIVNYVIKEQLINNSLSINQKYANKVAVSTDHYFINMLQELQYSAHIIGNHFKNKQLIAQEVHRLKYQSNNFNSVSVLNADANFLAFEPKSLKFNAHHTYKTMGITESLKLKKTYVSPPYKSTSNNLIVLLSQPIFDAQHHYLGMISGSIYLQKKNLISNLLTTTYPYKQSYIYVIDQNNRIVFHPDINRIGEMIPNNTGLAIIKQRKNGSIELTNNHGISHIVGFSYIPSLNWIVISQQPTEELFAEANSIILKTTIGMFIFYLLIFFWVWRITRYISSPLKNLAQMASTLNQPETETKIQKIRPWYFEIARFRTALLMSSQKFHEKVSELNQHINTDPLTGLYNRRGLQLFLSKLEMMQTDFAVLLIDVDYFKKVNDTYGHAQGDQVLKKLAELLKNNFRNNDICCRMGGEEFSVLMLTDDYEAIYKSAERLRIMVEQSGIPPMPAITISIGIAMWPKDADNIKDVFKLADTRLYQAKREGRNCIR